MKKTLVIADNDEIFVENLEEYIVRNHADEFEVRTFTEISYLESFFSKPKKIDILLLSPKFKFESMRDQYINNILFISDDEDSDLEYESVFRFGEITKIYNKLRSLVSIGEDVDYRTDKLIIDKSKVIGVYSPIGGIGKSTIAIALAMELASQGNKVLYLNLENMASTNAYFNVSTNSRNLSDIISYLSAGSDKLSSYLEGCINLDTKSNVFYINPADNIFDLEEMNQDDIKYLIQIIIDTRRFTHIVIDTSSNYNTLKKSIIDACDKIIAPLEQSSIGREKVLNFLKYIDEEELYKFIPIINKSKEAEVDFMRDICITHANFQIQSRINVYEPLQNSNLYTEILGKYNPFTASIKIIESLTNY